MLKELCTGEKLAIILITNIERDSLMRSAKGRKHDRKQRQENMKVSTTELSRQRRLANKAKRNEIHAIDPTVKVIIINQVTFDEHGTQIEVVNGQIKAVTPEPEILLAADEGEVNVMVENEPKKASKLRSIFKKW
jgi:uncharacterized protein YcbK (DUF882 family)|tara:strand:- start:71 stop:475 length:405 start_codon:yes stop_codon:yes gene_type:complete